MLNHASLFSGIGGFDLAAEWMGWNNLFHCEIDPFCQRVLKYHFPGSKNYENIKQTNFSFWRGKIDVLSGGFPCQPFSLGGQRKGTEDDRNLWPEMYRAVKEIEPKWVIGENVLGIISWNKGMVFEQVQSDLENEGYEVQAVVLPAASVNAIHRRDRVFFVAYSNNKGGYCKSKNIQKKNEEISERNENAKFSNTNERSIGGQKQRIQFKGFPSKSAFCGGIDGIPGELDSISIPKWRKESIKAYGNAVVPQVAYQLFQSIEVMTKKMAID